MTTRFNIIVAGCIVDRTHRHHQCADQPNDGHNDPARHRDEGDHQHDGCDDSFGHCFENRRVALQVIAILADAIKRPDNRHRHDKGGNGKGIVGKFDGFGGGGGFHCHSRRRTGGLDNGDGGPILHHRQDRGER